MPVLLLLIAGLGALLLLKKEAIVSTVASNRRGLVAMLLPVHAQAYVDLAFRVGAEHGVDPLIILAVMQRESDFGQALWPPGPTGTGDGGHGRGLMQIDDRTWAEWLRSHDWTDPEENIRKGAEILAQNLRFFSGRGTVPGITDGSTVTLSVGQATKRGVPPGAYADPRPLSGADLTAAAIAAYNTGPGTVLMSLAAGRPADWTTAHGDYSAWILEKIAEWSGGAA